MRLCVILALFGILILAATASLDDTDYSRLEDLWGRASQLNIEPPSLHLRQASPHHLLRHTPLASKPVAFGKFAFSEAVLVT
jgi:hypothetical protein